MARKPLNAELERTPVWRRKHGYMPTEADLLAIEAAKAKRERRAARDLQIAEPKQP